MSSFHEDLSRSEEVQGGSDRAFGLTVGGILLAIAAWRVAFGDLGWIEGILATTGGLLVGFGLLRPASLAPFNRLWTRLGLLLARVVSPVALGLIYALAIVPIGLTMRALGKDLLRLRTDEETASYWLRRDPPGPPPETMTRQF